jgi:hypothetical protein
MENTQPPATEETQPVTPVEEPAPQVDLAEEAGRAAAQVAPTEQKVRSLDDLDLDGAVRSKIESYVSKAINDAVSKHDERHSKKLKDDGYMNRSQIEELLASKDAEYQRRESAKESFLNILGSEGLHPGSEGYAKVQSTYAEAVQSGKLTPEILLTEAGIRTLVAMSGASPSAPAGGPQSGLARTAPEGSIGFADGTVQLNANAVQDTSLESRMRRAVEESARTL